MRVYRESFDSSHVGEVHGNWTELGARFRKDSQRHLHVVCRCGKCGSNSVVRACTLGSKSSSCRNCATRIHGQHGSREYRIWESMKGRCLRKTDTRFDDYGGRGIQICERWMSFQNFYADMGPRPSSRHSIDRIDVNGHYEPGNCRWATRKQQQRNMRSNRLFTINEQTLCLAEWCEKYGTTPRRVESRLRRGWDIERALTAPIHSRLRRISA